MRLILAALGLMLAAGPTPAADRYFLLVFGFQSEPKLIRYTHTFGAFVRVPDDAANESIQVVSISWMPRPTVLRPLGLLPQSGHNLGLDETLQFAATRGLHLYMWGPYEVDPGLFEKAAPWETVLRSGAPRYKVINRFDRPWALDCMHALARVDTEPGILHTRTASGAIASYFVLHHFARWIIQPDVTHERVALLLGLDHYPMDRLGFWDRPRSCLPLLEPWYSHPRH